MELSKLENYVNTHLSGLLSSMFRGVEFKGRFTADRDTDLWSDESEEIWNIKKGNIVNTYHIYFDDEHICTMNENDNYKEVDKNFLIGFMDAYKSERIYLNEGLRDEKDSEYKLKKIAEKAKNEKELEEDLAPLSADEKQIAMEVLDDTT